MQAIRLHPSRNRRVLLSIIVGLSVAGCATQTRAPDGTDQYESQRPMKTQEEIIVERDLSRARSKAESLGPHNPFLMSSLYSLAAFYRDRGDYTKAESVYQEALALKETTSGPDHPDVAMILENYARLLRMANRAKEATPLEIRAKAIRAKLNP